MTGLPSATRLRLGHPVWLGAHGGGFSTCQGGWPWAHAQVQVGAGPPGHTGARAWPLCCQLSRHLGGDRSPDRGLVFSPGHPLLPYSASYTPAQGASPGHLFLAAETAGGGAGSGEPELASAVSHARHPKSRPRPRMWGLLTRERIPPRLPRPHPGTGGWPVWGGGCRVLGCGLLHEARGQTSSCRSPPR